MHKSIDCANVYIYDVYMIQYSLWLGGTQITSLKELAKQNLTVSEHIRRAIDDYLKKQIKATTSPSK